MNMNRMEMPGSPIPTDKGSPRPARLSKVMPQAVFGKIILAAAAARMIFPKNPAQPGHGTFWESVEWNPRAPHT